LLDAITSIERTGREPKGVMQDVLNLVMQDLRTDFSRRSEYFRTLLSVVIVLFGAFPMMVAVLLTILASMMVLPLAIAFTFVSIMMSAGYIALIDAQVPKLADYTVVYKRILIRCLPLSISFVATLYFLANVPIIRFITSYKALIFLLASLFFVVPGYIEFKREARVVDEILEMLPNVIRDLADEIHRGSPPAIALERISESHSYGEWMDRLISLLIRRLRITGSLKEALRGLEPFLPEPMKVALGLMIVSEEYGARPESYHMLADILNEYMLSIREFKRGNQMYRWVSLSMVFLSVILVFVLFKTVVARIAMVSKIISVSPTPIPISIVTPEEIPAIRDWMYLMIAVNSSSLALAMGKTLDWRVGGGFRDLILVCIFIIVILIIDLLPIL